MKNHVARGDNLNFWIITENINYKIQILQLYQCAGFYYSVQVLALGNRYYNLFLKV